MKISTENRTRFGYAAAFLLLLIAFTYSVYTTDQLLYHIRWVSNTNKVLHNLESLMLEVKDLDGSFHNNGRDNSGIGDIHAFYNTHFNAIDSIYNILKIESQGEFIANKRLGEIDQYVQELHHNVIPKLQATGKSHSDSMETFQEGSRILDRIVSKIEDMNIAEKALLKLRSERLNNSTGSMKGINIVILIIALSLAGYSWLNYYNENKAKKKARSQMDEYAVELEKKVEELTKANTELIQLRSLQKFTSTGRIARMIAHEVRNPLTNINLSYDQLKDLVANNKQAIILLDTIMRNSNRINQLVSELLNATKEQELKYRKASINKLLNEAVDTARDRIELEHIKVKKDFSDDICDVKVDADKIKIAFLNIILNAVEAMPAGGGQLTLKTESKDNKCVVKIIDNGIGMDKDMLDKIFEPYFTGKTKGTGLGLTNTQNIIINHKGFIRVDSKVGVGTMFIVELEFANDDD